jgi:hypothetical protein
MWIRLRHRFTEEEDAKLVNLKERRGWSWEDIQHFLSRSILRTRIQEIGVVGNITPLVSTEALGISFPGKTPAAPATVGIILQRLPISKEMASFGSCDEGS